MEKISAEGHYTLLTRGTRDKGMLEIEVPCEGLGRARVSANFADGTVFTRIEGIDIDAAMLEELKRLSKERDDASVSPECVSLAEKITAGIASATHKVLSNARCYLRLHWLKESPVSFKECCWFDAQGQKFGFPNNFRLVIGVGGSFLPLDAKTSARLQRLVDSEISPLRAFRHLFRAIHESQPHHQWIDATIAAELAIKEAICIRHPQMQELLVECPSPPLDKLYGSLCEKYLGERSPYLKEIRRGVEVRNRIMHRHNSERVDAQEAVNYVTTIEAAIFHLLTLLYPGQELIAESYRLVKSSRGVPEK